ncbi:hypothetical protein FKM82_018219 [Ascaphus truei]
MCWGEVYLLQCIPKKYFFTTGLVPRPEGTTRGPPETCVDHLEAHGHPWGPPPGSGINPLYTKLNYRFMSEHKGWVGCVLVFSTYGNVYWGQEGE